MSPDETTLAVACVISNCIKVICVDGSEAPRTIGGWMGSGDGQFNYPMDVRFTPDGKLVVADFQEQLSCQAGCLVRTAPSCARWPLATFPVLWLWMRSATSLRPQ